MKTFPKLSQTTVRLGIGDGRSINVPMLPIARIGELKTILGDMHKCSTLDDFTAIRDRMISLAGTVLPPEIAEKLVRFQIPQLSELLGYLAYGDPDDDDQPVEDPAKKN